MNIHSKSSCLLQQLSVEKIGFLLRGITVIQAMDCLRFLPKEYYRNR